MNDTYTELYDKFRKLQWLMGKQRMTEVGENSPFTDTTRGQGRVLALLKIQPEISTKNLAYLLGIRQQSLNELLNKMENGGYVERKPSEADKRIMIIHLTDKGKSVQQPERKLPNIFTSLSREEQIIFGEYLDRIIKSLEEELGIEANAMEEWYENARNSMNEDRLGLLMERVGYPVRDMEHRGSGRRGVSRNFPTDMDFGR
jgi:DNA-binding MarR family transcriptional regulator